MSLGPKLQGSASLPQGYAVAPKPSQEHNAILLQSAGRPAMQTRAKIFDDLAKVAGGAASTLSGLKGEIESLARQQIERVLANIDVVPRDEFDAVQAMAAKARSEQEALEKRVHALEKKLGLKAPAKTQPKAKPKAKAKSKPKTKAAAGKTKPKK
jgi:hypothetical protein